MDIRKLELLVDIAETKNLTVSADKMGYTQSGVSHAIKSLEQELDIPLLARNSRGVTFTKEGEALLPHIRKITAQYKQLLENVNALNGLQCGSISVGAYSSIAIHWLPKIIHTFQHKYPNISLQIREGGLEEIEQWMYDGSVDFGLISHIPGQTFDFMKIAEDPLYAVVPKQFYIPPEFGDTFPVSAFSVFPFIAAEAGVDNDVEATLAEAGIAPPVRFYCKDEHSIIAMVENGLGISLLPALILQGYDQNLRKIPLDNHAARTLGIGAIAKENLSISAKAFIKVTLDALSEFLADI